MANLFNSARNLTRSMTDFSWVLSVFGVSQANRVMRGLVTGDPDGGASRSFDAATETLRDQLEGIDRAIYRAGEAVARGTLGSPPTAVGGVGGGGGGNVGGVGVGVGVGVGGGAPAASAAAAASAHGGPGLRPAGPIPPGRTAPPITETPGPDSKIVSTVAAQDFFPAEASGVYAEEAFAVYNVGTGTVDQTGSLINLNVDMFDFEGRWVGIQTGIQADYDAADRVVPLALATPPPPELPIDAPPVPHITRVSYTQGVWTFNDGSAIFAQGPSWTHMVPIDNGAFMFMVTTAHIVTKGSGVFEGVRGIKQGTGSSYIEPGLVQEGKFPAPGYQFTAKVIDTFRLIPRDLLDVPALGGKLAKVRP